MEGISKTSAHLPIIAQESLDEAIAHTDGIQRFGAFAFRSRDQARAKAQEFRRTGYHVRIISTFWDHYEQSCKTGNVRPIARDDIDESKPAEILARIQQEQPIVFDNLERARKNLWGSEGDFDGGKTILVLTQQAAALWNATVLTRAWHHPDFDPNGNIEARTDLRNRFQLGRIVFDDPESDLFLHLLPRSRWDFFRELQNRYGDWRNRSRRERLRIYRSINQQRRRSNDKGFDEFDSLMRADLERLESVHVDYGKIKFGHDGCGRGIYGERDGDGYYIGPKEWILGTASRNTYLTTEKLVADIIQHTLSLEGSTSPYRLNLTNVPGIYPVKISTYLDNRAGADRPDQSKVSTLAREILSANPNAIVISDGVRAIPEVKTFQSMKGLNGWSDQDVYVLVTSIAPEKFAELNVIGQWLGNPSVIEVYYQDLISQAVGRNRGFRQSSERETKTVTIASPRLWNSVLSKLQDKAPRVQLYPSDERPW